MSANAKRIRDTFIRAALLLAAAALLPAAAAQAAPPAQGDGGIVLSIHAPDAAAVSVVGDFNGWSPDATPLVRNQDGLWSATVALPPGRQAYRFVVDGEWLEDPDNGDREADPFGGFNSVVTVAEDGGLGAVSAAGEVVAAGGDLDAESLKAGTPRAVDGGILFTFRDPAAGSVHLAGSFNGWNSSDIPLVRNGKGTWWVIRKLDAGRHTYKFVVDGNWLADPENGDTESDGYGGSNSAVSVDDKGQVVAGAAPVAAAAATGTSLGAMNTKVTVDGRYLTRFELAKNILGDSRYRLLRPSMSADLNFGVAVNDVADAAMRLRMDSNRNVILNNIVSEMDEAELHVHPGSFDVRAYWNREIFTSTDPLRLMGDIDLPGTIGHDHLDEGKGTAGAVFTARPFGLGFDGYFANVHNADYYNDPDLYDNLGTDRLFARLHHQVGPVTLGLPIAMERNLLWMNFEALVGQPSTGIPALDDYLEGGDSSTWFETEQHDYKVGLDASLPLGSDAMVLSAQVMHTDQLGRFVTGNQTGQNNTNGGLDVPYFDREELLAGLRWDWRPDDGTSVRLQHTYTDQSGASADERVLGYAFVDMSVAENRVYFTVEDSPAQGTLNLTEIEAGRSSGDTDLKLYAWRSSLQQDYDAVGRTVPGEPARTDRTVTTWYLSGLAGAGDPREGFGHGELEFGMTLQDPDAAGEYYRSYEFIGRAERSISRHWSAVADVRWIDYAVDVANPSTGDVDALREDFWAPFAGLKYQPLRTLELVVGYGVDPVEFSIDYQGRQLGRWWFRQQYLFDNPDKNLLDAEQYLADTRVFSLRAQLLF